MCEPKKMELFLFEAGVATAAAVAQKFVHICPWNIVFDEKKS